MPSSHKNQGLWAQLRWFSRLRWIAAVAVVLGAAVDWIWLGWSGSPPGLLAIGVLLLAYNAVLVEVLRRWGSRRQREIDERQGEGVRDDERERRSDVAHTSSLFPFSFFLFPSRRRLLALAWAQVLIDLACLTLLVVWTGGARSPLIGFFVFHMVFASLLLPRCAGYLAAAAAGVMLLSGLWLTGQWPAEQLGLAGLLVTFVLTVYLADHLTHGLRLQRRRLIRQNRRIRQMARRLRQQQRAMIQHEKMIALGHMAAGVTHEIANPLASMDSLLQLTLRKPERLNSSTIQTLRQLIERIDRIIQQMKAFARPADDVRAQASAPVQQPVRINETVDQAVEMLRFDSRMAQVSIERQYDPQVGQVCLVPQTLEQILVNLIVNSLDAMGGLSDPRLLLRTERRGDQCLIEVADNGRGIAPEHLQRVFEPFFTTKPVGQGTGLGLSISYSSIRKQGGNISVRSNPGEGTSFTIRLPTSPQPTPAAAQVGQTPR